MSSLKYRHARNRLHISFPLYIYIFFFPKQSGGGCITLTWSKPHRVIHKYTCQRDMCFLLSNTCQRDICFLLSKVNNQSHLVMCLKCYVDIITSTKGYKNHTLEPLTKTSIFITKAMFFPHFLDWNRYWPMLLISGWPRVAASGWPRVAAI